MAAEDALRIVYFLEDNAHEQFIPPLVERLAGELGVAHRRIPITASGYSRGSRVLEHFRRFLRDSANRLNADLLVVCADDDCVGFTAKHKQFQDEVDKSPLPVPILYAIPQPYIEYWYLADKPALCKALDISSISITVPKGKCDRTIYKNLLEKACAEAGFESTGIEYGKDLVTALSLQRAMKHHPAKTFIEEARQALHQAWQKRTPHS